MEGTGDAKHLDGEISQLLALCKINRERIPIFLPALQGPNRKCIANHTVAILTQPQAHETTQKDV
jgi:hypothetical protein